MNDEAKSQRFVALCMLGMVLFNFPVLALFNVGGTLCAINNYCPHQGGPLCRGTVTGVAVADRPYEFNWTRDGEIVRCPWHRWEVDLLTGEVLTDPTLKVKRYPVVVEDGEIVVEA